MAAEKKYRIKVRLKVRNRLLKKSGLAMSVFLLAGVLGYCGFLASRLACRLPMGGLFAFTVKSLSVRSPSEDISAEISRRMSDKLGGPFSSGEAEIFSAGLKNSYPALSRVEVRRNFISGRVSVRAESENVVAKVRLNGGEIFYLSESGRLLAECYGPDPADIFETDVYSGPGLSLGRFAGFLKELRAMASEFPSRPIKLEYRSLAESCRLTLESSVEVLWGEFAFTKDKIIRLNEVLPDAARKIKGPLKVDFRYFRDGKIFVSKLTDI